MRYVPLREFFPAYRRVAMANDEVLVAIHIPFPLPSSKFYLRSYKQARRREDDIGIVSAGFQVELQKTDATNSDNKWSVVSACLSFGGMASTTAMAKQTQQELIGKAWSRVTIRQACASALKEMPLDETTPGGRPEYKFLS